jgi:hypothetical protein
MWKFFFILPIYPICEKKGFISLILRCFVEKRLQQDDLTRGYGRVYLPNALAGKYPNADDLHPRSQSRGKRGETSFGLYSIIQVCLT